MFRHKTPARGSGTRFRRFASGRANGEPGHRGSQQRRLMVGWQTMSKRTSKRKVRTKKKANHGKRPNCGRG